MQVRPSTNPINSEIREKGFLFLKKMQDSNEYPTLRTALRNVGSKQTLKVGKDKEILQSGLVSLGFLF